MKNILVLFVVATLASCNIKSPLIGEWVLATKLAFAPLGKSEYYKLEDRVMVVEFSENNNGDIIVRHDNKRAKLTDNNEYVTIDGIKYSINLDKDILVLVAMPPKTTTALSFYKKESKYWANNKPGVNIYTGEKVQ